MRDYSQDILILQPTIHVEAVSRSYSGQNTTFSTIENGDPKAAVVSPRSVKSQSFRFLSGVGFLSGFGLLPKGSSLNDGNDNIALIDSVLISNRVRNS